MSYIARVDNEKHSSKIEYLNFGYSEISEGRVVKPSESIEVYDAKDSVTIRLAFEYFKDVSTKIDYCSIYENCWRLNDNGTIEL